MTSEELELLTDIRDFTTLFYMILRRKVLQMVVCRESDLGNAICNMEPWP